MLTLAILSVAILTHTVSSSSDGGASRLICARPSAKGGCVSAGHLRRYHPGTRAPRQPPKALPLPGRWAAERVATLAVGARVPGQTQHAGGQPRGAWEASRVCGAGGKWQPLLHVDCGVRRSASRSGCSLKESALYHDHRRARRGGSSLEDNAPHHDHRRAAHLACTNYSSPWRRLGFGKLALARRELTVVRKPLQPNAPQPAPLRSVDSARFSLARHCRLRPLVGIWHQGAGAQSGLS